MVLFKDYMKKKIINIKNKIDISKPIKLECYFSSDAILEIIKKYQ